MGWEGWQDIIPSDFTLRSPVSAGPETTPSRLRVSYATYVPDARRYAPNDDRPSAHWEHLATRLVRLLRTILKAPRASARYGTSARTFASLNADLLA